MAVAAAVLVGLRLRLVLVLVLVLVVLLLLRLRALTGERPGHLVLQVLAEGPLLGAVVVVGQALALLVARQLLVRLVWLLRLHRVPAIYIHAEALSRMTDGCRW